MKGFQRLLAAFLIFCLFLPSAALGDLKRGDRSDLVKSVQEALRGGGFLDDKADGVFGKKTEKAVIEFQKTFDYEPTGILTNEQITHLLAKPEDVPDEFYTDGAGADGRGVENYCYMETRSDGHSYKTTFTYCDAHSWIVAPAEASLQNGEASDAARMYEEEVMRLYYALEERANEDAKEYVDTAYSAFGSMLDSQMMMLEKLYGAYDEQLFQTKRAELYRAQMVFLCGILNAEE